MIDRFTLFLGPARTRAFFIWIAATGLLSLILNVIVDDYEWVRPAQSVLALAALLGAGFIIVGRMEREDRTRWAGILLPALVAFIIGTFFLPHLSVLFFGLAAGWIVASLLVFRPRGPMEYQQAIKHLRKNQMAEAVKVMDGVIKENPDDPQHYRFRAELLRIWGKLDRARRDYAKMVEIDPENPEGHTGLSEVNLQAGDLQRALETAKQAYALASEDWVTLYNLGMIEDRLHLSTEVLSHLQTALELGVPDQRHRLLIYLYIARAHMRLGDTNAAQTAATMLQKNKNGLEEWQKIIESEQAAALKQVIGDDIGFAEQLVYENAPIEVLLAQVPQKVEKA